MNSGKLGKGGSSKLGRNSRKCAAYASSGRLERNKQRRLKKHLAKFPRDRDAQNALAAIYAG